MGTKEIKRRILRALQDKQNYEDVLRENAINLANHHKKSCSGVDCKISLFLLKELLRGEYKIELTEEEEKIFL